MKTRISKRFARRALLAATAALTCNSMLPAADVTSSWLNPASGTWSVASNWSSGVPDNGTQTFAAIINATGSPYTVTLNGVCCINDLTLNSADATLLHTAGTLSVVAGPINLMAGTFQLAGGAINGGTIGGSGGKFVLTGAGGTLSGVTVDANVQLLDDARQSVINGLVLNGTASLGGFRQGLMLNGTQTLGGSGTVSFESGRHQWLMTALDGMTLTIGPGITIRGGNGFNEIYYGGAVIGCNSNYGGGANASIINQGTIAADGAGMYLAVSPSGSFTNTGTLGARNGATLNVFGSWSSSGTININDGTLNMYGTIANSGAGIGAFYRTGGTVNLWGTLNNNGANLGLTADTGSWNLAGGTINGGTVTSSGGAKLMITGYSGTLNGVTVDGDIELMDDARPGIVNGLTLNGTITIGRFRQGLGFNGTQTLAGNGTVFFDDGRYQVLLPTEDGMTLTIGPGITISGGNSFNDTYNGAVIGHSDQYGGAANSSIINQGTISANTNDKYVQIRTTGTFTNVGTLEASNGGGLSLYGNWTNSGVIAAIGSVVNLGGSFSTPGTITGSNGTINITGTLDNTGQALLLSGGNTYYNLLGGTISGGSVAINVGKLTLTASGGTLNSVTVNTDLDLSGGSGWATVTNGLVLNGTATLGGNTNLKFAGTQTLGGVATIVFENQPPNALIALDDNMTLTLGPGVTVRGGGNYLYTAYIGNSNYWGGGVNASVVNQGTISADVSGMRININPSGTFSNTGTLEARNGGMLNISSDWASSGTLNISGGDLQVATTATSLITGRINYNAGGLYVGTLQLAGGGDMILSPGADKTARMTAISIDTAGGSKVDLADNRIIVDYTGPSPVDSIYQLVKIGAANGWSGDGITSSAAAADASKGIGVGENSVLGLYNFGGYSIDSTCVLLKYTWKGDANLDGKVDITDLAALATAWQTAGLWTGGDFDYSGFIDITDLAALATNWQAGVGAPLSMSFKQALASVGLGGMLVPEPMLAGMAVVALLARRRRAQGRLWHTCPVARW